MFEKIKRYWALHNSGFIGTGALGSHICPKESLKMWAVGTVTKVYRGYFWMGCFDASSSKRHVIWSNDHGFVDSIIAAGGYLSHAQKQSLCSRALVNHTTDPRTGRKRFTGVKKALKASQSPDWT